ncbi:MAG: ATP-binding cassette domain-containing protein [Clostridia bacterium]|nr:ATP-binding cassette domain-containing protein [Clostridia bacterium]
MTLTLSHLDKSYKSTHALNDVSAELTPGIYALLGPNGSGKSTLMNILTGNLDADGGDILFADGTGNPENVRDMGVHFREKLGYMPQYPGLYPDFTAERFLWYMAALKGIEKDPGTAGVIADILEQVELSEAKDKKIKTFSGGMKQRLALAQAVLGDPAILILDEPTAGLDPRQRIAVRNYISKIAFDKIVLIATHVVADIEFIAKEILLLKKGYLIDRLPPQELTRRMTGKVWNLSCDERTLGDMQVKYRVINISRDETGSAGGVLLRILCEERPDDTSEGVTVTQALPTLEDAYLYYNAET